jgi:hypothetical protein
LKRPIIVASYVWLMVLNTWAGAQVQQPSGELLHRIDQAIASGALGAYVSTSLAMNPCLDAPKTLGHPWEPGEAERIRSGLPTAACEDSVLANSIPRLFVLQSLILAATDQPLAMQATVAESRKNLRACEGLTCARTEVERATLEFSRQWDALRRQASDSAAGTARSFHSVKDPVAWLSSQSPGVFKHAQASCGDSRVIVTMQVYKRNALRQALVVCDQGGVESPGWLLEKQEKQWTQILALESMGTLRLLASSHHGRFDLMNTVRASMGEHPSTVYTYNGKVYVERLFLDIQSTSIGEVAVIPPY